MLIFILLVCATFALVGCLLTLGSAFAVRGFARHADEGGASPAPAITILKPLHGAEPGLYRSLLSFLQQDYAGAVQVIFGVSHASDAALPVVRRLIAEHPTLDLDVVIGHQSLPGNGKIVNLVAMSKTIRHDCIVLSDSDMRVERDYLTQVAASLSESGVGLVTCLYRGESERGPWALLSSMAIDYHFFPSVLLGIRLKKAHPCMGATMAFSRETLEAIGGFGAFSRCLADDYAIGEAVRAIGLRVVVGRQVIVHRCTERSLTDLFQHELRWAITLRTIDPRGFAGSFLTNPLPFALLAAMTSHLLPGFEAIGAGTLATTVFCRMVLQRQIERRLDIATRRWILTPARDILSFVVFCSSFLVTDVVWRGHRYRVSGDGTLTDLKGTNP